ncbi:MAG: hypothetical protein LBE12_17135 [Planctomycetaceae bacterium]|nr:hypothetical protein [Planctomycetaceae bacterium]
MRNYYRLGSNLLATLSTINYQLSTINSPLSTLHYQLSLLSRRRALENGRVPAPAVTFRLTADYAFHTPSGVKSKKQKFHG